MTKRTVPDMKELFKQAAEIAQQVPESMQEAAFNRALDLLVEASGATDGASARPGRREKKSSAPDPPPKKHDPAGGGVDVLLRDIDSTKHPGVRAATKVLDQSLLVLQIALNEHHVDGLTPPEISRILKEKFRLSTSRQAIGMALKDAAELVDRVSEGRRYRYRIMAPGEEYLAHNPDSDNADTPPRKSRRRAGKGIATKTRARKRGTSADGPPTKDQEPRPRGAQRATGRNTAGGKVGPKAAILGLVQQGYLNEPRTGPEIQTYLNTKKGIKLGTDQIRMAMLRLVRDDVLDRNEREDGQYEYSKL